MTLKDLYKKQSKQCKQNIISTIFMRMMFWSEHRNIQIENHLFLCLPWYFKDRFNNENYDSEQSIF